MLLSGTQLYFSIVGDLHAAELLIEEHKSQVKCTLLGIGLVAPSELPPPNGHVIRVMNLDNPLSHPALFSCFLNEPKT